MKEKINMHMPYTALYYWIIIIYNEFVCHSNVAEYDFIYSFCA